MTDRELLEAAAKAAGNGAMWHDHLGMGVVNEGTFPTLWNPLKNDGDAFRLAVNLGMKIDHGENGQGPCAVVGYFNPTLDGRSSHLRAEIESASLHSSDQCATTRRAIVRAAAAAVCELHEGQARMSEEHKESARSSMAGQFSCRAECP